MTDKPIGGHSAACCNTPPVISEGYVEEGTWQMIAGMNSYVTGSDDCDKAILFITDIFGFYEQTVQAGDIMANRGITQYKVFMPDWFQGEPAPVEWLPPDTEEKKKNLAGFFNTHDPTRVAASVPQYIKECQEKYPRINTWGVHGLCWGAKVVSLLVAQEDSEFRVGSECHPSLMEPDDALSIKRPLIVLASEYGILEVIRKFEENLRVEKYVEIFPDMVHGWMGARADFDGGRKEAEYRRGYKLVLQFFHDHW